MPIRGHVARLGASLLTLPVAAYITAQRNRLAPHAVPLPPSTIGHLAGYFPPADLDRARLLVATPLPVAEPPLAGAAARLGFAFPSVSGVAGITFDHVIAVRSVPDPSLLFHELIHVVQYRLLGVRGFSRKYVEGFLRTGRYESIPLEEAAYELEERYAAGGPAFLVEQEIRRRLV